jgi:Tfp pilus assembly protein PilX
MRMTIRTEKTEEPRGAALIVALIVMSMLSLFVISSLEMLIVNVQINSNHVRDLQALYIADAGIEDAIARLRDDPNWDDGLSEEFPSSSGNTYTVVVDNSEYPSIVITSTGSVPNFQRSIEVEVEIAGSSSPYSVTTTYWKEI